MLEVKYLESLNRSYLYVNFPGHRLHDITAGREGFTGYVVECLCGRIASPTATPTIRSLSSLCAPVYFFKKSSGILFLITWSGGSKLSFLPNKS